MEMTPTSTEWNNQPRGIRRRRSFLCHTYNMLRAKIRVGLYPQDARFPDDAIGGSMSLITAIFKFYSLIT